MFAPAAFVPKDVYLPGIISSTSGPTRSELVMAKHGLPTLPELTGSQDLHGCLECQGLGKQWGKVREAYYFAKQAHAGQQRDDGSPYYHHPARTAKIAIEQFGVKDADAINAMLLHDVLEDTSVKPAEIERRFGAKTLHYVNLLSKPEPLPGETFDQRNARYLQRIEDAGLPDLIALKLADRMDNIDDVHLVPDRPKIGRYLEDTKSHYLPLAQRHFPEAAQRMSGRIERVESWLSATV